MADYILLLLLLALILLFVTEMIHSMKRSRVTGRLIKTYFEDSENPKVIDEIYAYCSDDYKLRRLVKKYAVSREDIEKIYQKLLLWGNFKKDRRFVPISSFFYVYSFEYLVKHKNEDAKDLTVKMMNFFRL
ncbi:MAG: hypothetical protein IJ849_10505 [Selenomonadaceae bacterium]|nr:hypothetical protein [Selenomonadaceae bacterium]